MNTPTDPRLDPTRVIRAPRGSALSCKNWVTEAAYRMLQNNLDAEVAENPQHLVVYGGIGRAARDWACFDQILASLRELEEDETLLVQSGKPVGVFKTHPNAPRVLIANSNLVPKWANWEHFNELDRKGLFMYGQMTAGSWIYIGSQGIVQGTFETFVEAVLRVEQRSESVCRPATRRHDPAARACRPAPPPERGDKCGSALPPTTAFAAIRPARP